ncbi:MAG: right-handed parallel beta-helix repeat-containing protein [Clostridia bacterium]|nr:right-handed parallel beta-helix repeat-containing protein [Clostridia bacterium]
MNDYFINPKDFGAIGDGIHDDTEAIRAAIQKASEGSGVVKFSFGTYRTDVIDVPQAVCIKSEPTWAFRTKGRTVLIPAKEEQNCIFDVSGASGATISGLCICGNGMGSNMHGISMDRERRRDEEHAVRIDTCQIREFSGNGLNLIGAWAVSVRHSHSCHNGGYGLYLDGTDAFIVDNWFSGNKKAGFGGDTWNSAVNFTSNRVEWNGECGIRLSGGMRYNITGNYIDRSFGPAIIIEDAENYHKRLHKTHTVMPYAITVTGNTIVRSGKTAEDGSDGDCHIFMKRAAGIAIVGNTFNVWKDDGRNGRISPHKGIIIEQCSHCVIANNTMLPGAVKELIEDRGGHGDQVIIKDNVGDTVPERAWNCQDPFTPVHFMSEGGAPWFSEQLAGESND